jgi:hypothetical protein
MIGWPIGRNIVCSNPPSHFLPYNNSPLYLCFPFVGWWFTYSKSHIKCGSCFLTIVTRVFSMRVFGVANEVCNLVSTRVGPLYITSSWFFYYWLRFLYFGHRWDLDHSLSCLWLRLFIMFPFLGILEHYAEFDICTITMLEKLYGVGSFGGFINHLAHC